jgi:hypothetical protein
VARAKKQRTAATDPLLRACTACGALIGQGCYTVGRDGKQLPRITRASRLVHAARLEGATDA